jgi:hypothetical protein
MTTTALPRTTALAVPAERPHRHHPSLEAVLRRLGSSVLVACVVPACLFYTSFRIADVWTAMLVALAWSCGAITWRAANGRRTSGLLLLSATVMTARTVIAFVTDSSYVYFLQPIITDGLIGATFLLSLATARPLASRLAGDFYPLDDDLATRPRMQRLLRRVSLLWGCVALGKAIAMLWLLNTLALPDYVLVKSVSAPVLNASAVAVTVALAISVARKEGLLGSGRRS